MSIISKLKEKFSNNQNSDKYLSGFAKTSQSLSSKLSKMSFGFNGINEAFLEELMIVLLESDMGIQTADKIVSSLAKKADEYHYITYQDVMGFLLEIMQDLYGQQEYEFTFNENGPTVILMVGVNGSGKTTTTAKLIRHFQRMNKTVAVVAADTFRAGAIEQLTMWAQRMNVPCVAGKEKTDPSSVLVDGCRYGVEHKIDVLICDTAGRLQNKANLMNELSKMKRVIGKEIEGAPHACWLVLDATTGQNGLSQAKIFLEVTDVDGIILTKMDGTAKGGIILSIKDTLNIPVLFVGLGEKPEDLSEFDVDSFLYSISSGIQDA